MKSRQVSSELKSQAQPEAKTEADVKAKKRKTSQEDEDALYFGGDKFTKVNSYTPPANAPEEVKELLMAKHTLKNIVESKLYEPKGRQPTKGPTKELTQEMLDRIQKEMRSF